MPKKNSSEATTTSSNDEEIGEDVFSEAMSALRSLQELSESTKWPSSWNWSLLLVLSDAELEYVLKRPINIRQFLQLAPVLGELAPGSVRLGRILDSLEIPFRSSTFFPETPTVWNLAKITELSKCLIYFDSDVAKRCYFFLQRIFPGLIGSKRCQLVVRIFRHHLSDAVILGFFDAFLFGSDESVEKWNPAPKPSFWFLEGLANIPASKALLSQLGDRIERATGVPSNEAYLERCLMKLDALKGWNVLAYDIRVKAGLVPGHTNDLYHLRKQLPGQRAPLVIVSYNLKQFGAKPRQNPASLIEEHCPQYPHVLAFQEVQQLPKKGNTVDSMMKEFRRQQYRTHIAADRTGTNSRDANGSEYPACVYDPARLQLLYHGFVDPHLEVSRNKSLSTRFFGRVPYAWRFKDLEHKTKFTLVSVHLTQHQHNTGGQNRHNELSELLRLTGTWPEENDIVIVGDFNYANETEVSAASKLCEGFEGISLFSEPPDITTKRLTADGGFLIRPRKFALSSPAQALPVPKTGAAYSDHNPIVIELTLRDEDEDEGS